VDGKIFTVGDTPGEAVHTAGSDPGSGEHSGDKVSWRDRASSVLWWFAQNLLSLIGTLATT